MGLFVRMNAQMQAESLEFLAHSEYSINRLAAVHWGHSPLLSGSLTVPCPYLTGPSINAGELSSADKPGLHRALPLLLVPDPFCTEEDFLSPGDAWRRWGPPHPPAHQPSDSLHLTTWGQEESRTAAERGAACVALLRSGRLPGQECETILQMKKMKSESF